MVDLLNMEKNPRKFSEMLTKAIRKICFEKNIKIGVLQDEIGFAMGFESGANLIYWRSRKKIPAYEDDIANLASELIKRGQFDKTWLEEFLTAAGYSNTIELCEKIFPLDTEEVEDSLPRRMYGTLVGRKSYMNRVMGALHDESSKWMVAIDGMGGIGKSAIAIEIGHRSKDNSFFKKVIWISAARGIGSSFTRGQNTDVTYNSILNDILISFGFRDMRRLEIQEKKNEVQKLLGTHRSLLILDNMDTASEPQNEIARRLFSLLNPSKVLLTSRHRFSGELYQINLGGLEVSEAKAFLRQEADNRNISRLKSLDSENIELIIHSTGGSPLAMKLISGQLGHMPVEVTLDYLRRVKPLHGNSSEDEYIKFYQGIFSPSWNRLAFDSKKLLLAMTQFPLDEGGPLDAIRVISELEDDKLNNSLKELWNFSFLEATYPESSQTVYYMHPLTHNFVLADLAKIPK